MGACGDGLPCIMAADFHPTSSSGVQVDGNGQIQPVRGCRGRASLFLRGSPAKHAPDSRRPPRARLPDTRAGRWVVAATAVEDTGRLAQPRITQQIWGRGGRLGQGEGGPLGPGRPSG